MFSNKLNQLQLISENYSSDENVVDNDKNYEENKNDLNTSLNFKKELICAVCSKTKFKYNCPSCLNKTCSLNCYKDHKKLFDCSGIKSCLKYKRISNFDDKQMKDDFFFLEDCNRSLDGIKRQRRNVVQSLSELPSWLKKLKFEANCRNIKLKILPAGFKRRIINKTTYMYSLKEIHWNIELTFTDLNTDQDEKLSFILNRVSEKKVLNDILQPYLKPENLIENQKQNKLLKFYRENEDICVLLKLEFDKFVELNLNNTINQCLKDKTIVEFPTLYIILRKNLEKYDVIKETEIKVEMKNYIDQSFNLLKNRNNKNLNENTNIEQSYEIQSNDVNENFLQNQPTELIKKEFDNNLIDSDEEPLEIKINFKYENL